MESNGMCVWQVLNFSAPSTFLNFRQHCTYASFAAVAWKILYRYLPTGDEDTFWQHLKDPDKWGKWRLSEANRIKFNELIEPKLGKKDSQLITSIALKVNFGET